MRSFLKPQLLIIDDLGLTGFTQEQTEAFYEIIAERHHTGSIVVTSNRPPGDWPGLFPDQVLAMSGKIFYRQRTKMQDGAHQPR